MVLDARHRSSIYGKFVPLLGEDDANALMTAFPSIEADELVTKQFLRAEMAELRAEFAELRGEFADLRGEVADQRSEFAERMHQQTVRLAGALGGAITVSTAVLGTLIAVS